MDMEDNLSTDDVVRVRPRLSAAPPALVASDSETTVLWPRSTITMAERGRKRGKTSSSGTAEFLARLALLHSKESFSLIDLWLMVIAREIQVASFLQSYFGPIGD